jgi:hypothetical protein
MNQIENAGVPLRTMAMILDTLSHSSLNSSIHLSTSSEKKVNKRLVCIVYNPLGWLQHAL